MTPRYVGRHRAGVAPGTDAQRAATLTAPLQPAPALVPMPWRPALRLFGPIAALAGGAR